MFPKNRNTQELAILLKNLTNNNPNIRVQSVIKLGNLGDEEAIPALCKTLLEDRDPEVRCHAAEALGKLNSSKIGLTNRANA